MLSEEKTEANIRRKTLIWVFRIFLIAFCFVGGLALGIALFVINGLNPLEPGDPLKITIEQGMHSGEIAELLEERGIIKNGMIFSYYLRFQNEGSRFQAGTYEMAPGMTLDEIIEKLNRGDVIQETIRFTIPEGFTVEQMADRLAGSGLVDRETFLDTVQNHPFANQLVRDIPDHPDIKYRLEGYLFPETYEMKKGSTETEIVERMLSELENRLSELPADWRKRLDERGMTFHEMLTIASLIEREVVLDEERPVVSGIIDNRLKAGMPLQIDATVQYLFEEQKEIVTKADLEIDDPYNTYRNSGLPPGPISSPGFSSIFAALYPEDTTFMFYVTKKDGSRGHYFAETFEEHRRNIARSKQAESQ